MKAPMWRRIGTVFIVPLIFAGLTIILTYPVITELDSSLAQNPAWGTDAFHHTYVLWWFKQALFDLHTSPANLSLIYFPTGNYYPLLLTYSAVYLPGLLLQIFLSPIATYNFLFMLTFFFSGLSAYALCAHLTGNRWAGLLGGIVYAFFPNRVAHAFSGHLELISTYLFPVYLLLLIKTVERPRLSTSVLCGFTLAASILVQPMYIVFLLAPITLIWLLWERLALHRSFERRTWMSLAVVFGVAALLTLPFFWPVLREQTQGAGEYLQGTGIVAYSADLFGIVTPSPLNPLLNALKVIPTEAQRIVPVNDRLSELLIYAGMTPLALSALAVWAHRRKMGAWILIAVAAAVLALGPLLKVNGTLVTFHADLAESHVPLPYALVMNLPLISYSRAPARLNVTLMLTVAVLSAYGLAWLLSRTRSGWRNVIAGALCLITLGEFIVIWPLPVTHVAFPPELSSLARSGDHRAVLNLPVSVWSAKEAALFYQTLHTRPVFDSWVQRSLPDASRVAEFLEGLLLPGPEQDIIPLPSISERSAIARTEGVGHILLFNRYAANAEAQAQLLIDTLGRPQLANAEMTLLKVPAGPSNVDQVVYALPAEGWWAVESWGGRPARWIPNSADLYLYSPREQAGVLRFMALPVSTHQRLQIEINGTALPPLVIGDWMTFTTPLLTVRPGLNRVTLRSLDGCVNFTRDPRCSGPARSGNAECSPSLHWERCLSILFQDIRFVADPTGQPIEALLGSRVRLLGYEFEGIAQPGQSLVVTLSWQAIKPLKQDYTIFIHLLGPDGHLLAQHDGLPLRGLYPTSQWVTGDVFTYRAMIEIPSDAPPGKYTLLAGMYTYPDLKRLPVASERPFAQDGLVWLQEIEMHR